MQQKRRRMILAVILFLSVLYPYAIPLSAWSQEEKVDVSSDLEGHWAEEIIRKLQKDNIVSGKEVNGKRMIMPDAKITRAEFLKLLLYSLYEEKDIQAFQGENTPFEDVRQHWARQLIGMAYREGLVKGMTPSLFHPDHTMTRAQMVTLVIRATRMGVEETVDEIKDVPKDHWAYEMIVTAKKKNVLKGYRDGTFQPEAVASRAEAMTTLGRVVYEMPEIKKIRQFSNTQKTPQVAKVVPTVPETVTPVAPGVVTPTVPERVLPQLTITVENFIMDDTVDPMFIQVYDAVSSLSGELKNGGKLRTISYEIVAGKKLVMASGTGTIETDASWKIPAIKLYNGENRLRIVAINEKSQEIKKEVIIKNNVFESPDALGLDKNDTDADELANYLEDYLGTMKEVKDTDVDGLTDFQEYALTKTSPLLKDTNQNGKSDDAEDEDLDRLSNMDEIRAGTNPQRKDTDLDGLLDGDEFHTYKTSSLQVDNVFGENIVEEASGEMTGQCACDPIQREIQDLLVKLDEDKLDSLRMTFSPTFNPVYPTSPAAINLIRNIDFSIVRFYDTNVLVVPPLVTTTIFEHDINNDGIISKDDPQLIQDINEKCVLNETLSPCIAFYDRRIKFIPDVTGEEMVQVGTPGVTYSVPIGASETPTNIAGGFWMGRTEVTYAEWYEVRMWAEKNGYVFANRGREGHDGVDGATPTSARKEPVTMVSWYDVVVWSNAKSERQGLTPVYRERDSTATLRNANNVVVVTPLTNANGYRLPTNHEWEMTARWLGTSATLPGVGAVESPVTTNVGGVAYYWTPGRYGSGARNGTAEEFRRIGWWWAEGSPWGTRAVGLKASNTLGMRDVSGNVWEWTFDLSYGTSRGMRGGSWSSDSNMAVSIVGGAPSDIYTFIGFRLARTAL